MDQLLYYLINRSEHFAIHNAVLDCRGEGQHEAVHVDVVYAIEGPQMESESVGRGICGVSAKLIKNICGYLSHLDYCFRVLDV